MSNIQRCERTFESKSMLLVSYKGQNSLVLMGTRKSQESGEVELAVMLVVTWSRYL